MPKTANTKIRCSGYGSSKALYFPSLSSFTLSLPSPHTFYFRVWNLLIFAILKLERGKSVIVCLFSALSFSIIFALLYLVIVQKKSLFPSSFLLKFWTYSVGWTWCSRNQNNRLVSSKATLLFACKPSYINFHVPLAAHLFKVWYNSLENVFKHQDILTLWPFPK